MPSKFKELYGKQRRKKTRAPRKKKVESPTTKEINALVDTVLPSDTKIYALGGLNEVGKNMYCFEHEDEIIVVDSGVLFPENELLGVDYVIPDYTYLKENRDKFKGVNYYPWS